MTDKKISSELLSLLSKTVIHQAQRVKELYFSLQNTFTDQRSFEHFEQAVTCYAEAAEQFSDTTHIEIANKLKQTLTNASKTALNELERSAIHQLIQKIENLGLRESDVLEASKNKKPRYFFAGQHNEIHQRLLKKLLYFNINCHWLDLKHLDDELLIEQPNLLLFDSSLLQDEAFSNLLIKRKQLVGYTNIGLYYGTFPNSKIRAKALRKNVDLINNYNFPSLIETLNKKSHIKQDKDISLFILEPKSEYHSVLRNYSEQSDFNLHRFTSIYTLIDELNHEQVDAILIAPHSYQESDISIASFIRQQNVHVHIPIISIDSSKREHEEEHYLPIIGIKVDDTCNIQKFRESLLSKIEHTNEIKNLISKDHLTGLLSHRFFINNISLQLSSNPDKEMTLIMLDIDHFKKVNDKHGHQTGDSVLQTLSLYLQQHLRYTDPIGRYGGEEFAILLDVEENQAFNIIDKIRQDFASFEHMASLGNFKVTLSCGLARWRNQSIKLLVQQADKALYQAKQGGRNRCIIYKDEES